MCFLLNYVNNTLLVGDEFFVCFAVKISATRSKEIIFQQNKT